MNEPTNEGVIIGGNARVSGPVAGGRHARAEQYQLAADDTARQRLAEVRTAVRQHRDELADPDWIEGDLDEVEQEIGKPRPDRDRVVAALNRLARRATAVTSVAAAVAKLHEILAG